MDKERLALEIRATIVEMGANTKAEAQARAFLPHVAGYKMVSASHLQRLVIYAGALSATILKDQRDLQLV